MFRPRHRAGHTPDLLDWGDYRWSHGPRRPSDGGAAFQPGSRRGGHRLLRILLAAVAIVVGLRLLSRLQSADTRGLRRGLYAALLLLLAAVVARGRDQRRR